MPVETDQPTLQELERIIRSGLVEQETLPKIPVARMVQQADEEDRRGRRRRRR
ncbi:MAG: hypothetical protein KDE56_17760 [Anaerolineales bacterium]|nr:hypothetical protein [Anaerolineales bacterium]